MAEPIGRQRECAAVTAFLDGLANDRGGVLLLEGEGGTGKTTLAEWGIERAARRGFAIVSGRSWELSQSVPYEPIVAGLGRFLRAEPDDARGELTRGLSSLAALFDGLGVPDPVAAGGPDASRARLHEAVATVFARIANRSPTLFVLDDLHWCDASSLELVQLMCRDLPYVQLGIVATVRPADADERAEVRSFLAPLRRAAFSSSVTVRNLDWDETAELVRSRLSGEPPDRLLELIWSRSIGTPLLAYEMIEDLIARRLLIHECGSWTLAESDPSLPRVATDLIRDRVDRAEPAERALLEILAIADEPTPMSVLAAVSSQPETEIASQLRALIDKRLVAETIRGRGRISWHAEHPIISHVVASQLDGLVRQRLHRRLAEADPDAPPARRARHILGGGRPTDARAALDVLIEAGTAASNQAATAQAVDMFRAADRQLAELPDPGPASDDDDRDELAYQVNLGLGSALTRTQENEEAVQRLERAWAHVGAGDRFDAQLALLARLDQASFLAGQPLESITARLDTLEQTLTAIADWDRLTELVLSRVIIAGRSWAPDLLEELERSLVKIGDRQLGTRASLIRDLLTISLEMYRGTRWSVSATIDELIEIRRGTGDWDVQYRAALFALELAGRAGVPHLVQRSMAHTRRIEAEVGESPNWRIPILRAIAAVCDGQDTTDLALLGRVGELVRSTVLTAFVDALGARYREGPEAALSRFDEACTGADTTRDKAARIYVAHGRLVIGEGHPDEERLCHEVLATNTILRSQNFSSIAIFDHAALLAQCVAGPPDEAVQALAELGSTGFDHDLPSAWRHLGLARLERERPAKARRLLDAAEHLEACGYRLEAASRRIEAAEIDRTTVDDAVLAASLEFATVSGATWLVNRARANSPNLMRPSISIAEDGLTKREWEVAYEVARGLTNREVGQELFISIRTVTSHLDHIYSKLGISSREELSAYVDGSPSPIT